MPTVTIPKAIDAGLRILKANFWPCILIVVILGILDSFGQGSSFRQGIGEGQWWRMAIPIGGGFLAFVIGVFIKPVFDYSTKLIFVRANRGDYVDVKDIVRGFDSKNLYIDIILTNIMISVSVIVGFIFLILPGIYIASRTVLAPFLVMDKGLAPQQAYKASWELMRDFWPQVILLGIVSFFMCIVGLLLLIVGIFPAIAWIKGMFASFYQQVIDAHDEEFLLSLDIAP